MWYINCVAALLLWYSSNKILELQHKKQVEGQQSFLLSVTVYMNKNEDKYEWIVFE